MKENSVIYKFLSKIILNPKWYFGIIVLICIATSLQHYIYTPPIGSTDAQFNYTHYNDYLIFKQSFFHLIHHKNLYINYPYEYYDLYKYTPTFALLMAPFARLDNLAGLLLWNVLNACILFIAFRKFPFSSIPKQLFAIGFILIEAITSLQTSESNCLMDGLIILTFISLENKKTGLASFLIILSVFIKPFALAAFPLFLFYPGKMKAFLFSLLWFAIFLLLPLLVISPHELIDLYINWGMMLKDDHAVSYGFSVMGWLHTWFGIDYKNYVLFAGIILFFLPLLRFKSYPFQRFRVLFLSSVLLWVIIFNHKAESPGYIIAISGVAIWFSQSSSALNTILLAVCFLFCILAPTDLYPAFIRHNYFIPFVVKAVPCIFIWVKILIELLTAEFG